MPQCGKDDLFKNVAGNLVSNLYEIFWRHPRSREKYEHLQYFTEKNLEIFVLKH